MCVRKRKEERKEENKKKKRINIKRKERKE